MQKVTGSGGVFLKSVNAKALAAWYDKHLGFSFGENLYVNFKWVNENNPAVPGNTVFSFVKRESSYFDLSDSPFMINLLINCLWPCPFHFSGFCRRRLPDSDLRYCVQITPE